MAKEALFIRFINRKLSIDEILRSFSKASDAYTAQAALKALDNPPDIENFRQEMIEAVTDIIKEGYDKEFTAFVNHYMESTLEEDISTSENQLGENVSRTARVINDQGPWIQGLICYNLCLYIKAFGLESLKKCKVCGTFFDHKGKYALYCSDSCKKNKNIPL